jgi:hypothetical protein
MSLVAVLSSSLAKGHQAIRELALASAISCQVHAYGRRTRNVVSSLVHIHCVDPVGPEVRSFPRDNP